MEFCAAGKIEFCVYTVFRSQCRHHHLLYSGLASEGRNVKYNFLTETGTKKLLINQNKGKAHTVTSHEYPEVE
jgi:hypothetical protein